MFNGSRREIEMYGIRMKLLWAELSTGKLVISYMHSSFENRRVLPFKITEQILSTQWLYRICTLDWSYIEFIDNQDILDLIEKKPAGIIALLDEVRMFPRSIHETFAESYIRPLKIISGSASQSCLGLLLLFATMLTKFSSIGARFKINFARSKRRNIPNIHIISGQLSSKKDTHRYKCHYSELRKLSDAKFTKFEALVKKHMPQVFEDGEDSESDD
ncbi:hypothetical protein T459_08955 [Capsicum annuum]|uniref:Myosin motor domain-containing protein n=1 Tax=Capsicum annuum TaxID=4072 RepID=A0A2G2ZY04_CAPAN|nr:hypothetical protein T459_08955 [Capsicum annuum]